MRWLLVPCVISLAASPALAGGDVTSVYSDLDLAKCENLLGTSPETNPEYVGGEWLCRGIPGHDVHVWEGDLRTYVAYGRNANAQCAAAQTFGAFNSPGPKIEWRLKAGLPFATILRWFTEGNEIKRNWLVVTKYAGREACHVAYVDTRTPDANSVARNLADTLAPGFACLDGVATVVSADRPAEDNRFVTETPCPTGPYREE